MSQYVLSLNEFPYIKGKVNLAGSDQICSSLYAALDHYIVENEGNVGKRLEDSELDSAHLYRIA